MKELNFDNVIGFKPRSITSSNAWVGHIPFAAWIIQQFKANIFVELGSYSGNSYFAFCQSVQEENLSVRCYAVDTWEGDEHSGYYGDHIFNGVDRHNKENYTAFSTLIRGLFDDTVSYFSDQSIDILHIDGLHTYEAVSHDFKTWLPKLAPGAIVLFHDTNVRERDFGVWKFWEEIKEEYPNNIEFFHSNGLGILQLNNAPENKKLEWLDPNSLNRKRVQEVFTQLGDYHLKNFDLIEQKRLLIEQEGKIFSLNEIVSKQNQEIQQLNELVGKQNQEIQQLNEIVGKQNQEIQQLNEIINISNDELSNKNESLALNNQAVNSLRNELSLVYSSRSWRITKIFRNVSKFLLTSKS